MMCGVSSATRLPFQSTITPCTRRSLGRCTYRPGQGNGAQQVQTYIYASWVSPGVFSGGTIQDITPLSHEVSEWLNDPFVDNISPPWSLPGAPQYGCSTALEAGDPLVGFAYPITLNGFTYRPQVIPILPWFARQSPSQAVAGAYSYPDTNVLTSPATGC
jgi:hypothetical protein